MRIQTLFGRISAEAHEQFMGTALVTLRVSFGVYAFALSKTAVTFPPVDAVILMIVGIAFITGLLVRPAGVLFVLMTVLFDALIIPFEEVKALLPLHVVLIVIASLGVAGGLGHAFGFNGMVLRNISRPGRVVKFLFG